jgi:fibro-slime domain-containing protein
LTYNQAVEKFEFALASNLATYNNNNQNLFPNTSTGNDSNKIEAYIGYQFPFRFENGYYSFESEKHHVYFNSSARAEAQSNDMKLTLREGQQVKETVGIRTPWNALGWFPFNEPGAQVNNVYFGMRMDFPFVMPPDRKAGEADVIYEFDGDDDHWVYIDGKLALDLGGKGGKTGSINFTTGLITVNQAAGRLAQNLYDSLTGPIGTLYWNLYGNENLSSLGGYTIQGSVGVVREDFKEHTISIFYMERGGYDSNCNMRFNLPILTPDALNVIKYADGDAPEDEQFGFDVYASESNEEPAANLENVTPINEDPFSLVKSSSFAAEIPTEAKWVRVVERPTLDNGGEEQYSTVYLGGDPDRDGSGSSDPDKAIFKRGKDSGWIAYDGGTQSLFCVNYTQHPIELVKYKLDGATLDTKDTLKTEDDEIQWQVMPEVTFSLYKGSGSDTNNPVATNLTTDADGRIYLNDPYGDSPQLDGNTTYFLRETAPAYYKETPDIYFQTTNSGKPRVFGLWYFEDENKEKRMEYTSGDGYGQIAFAGASGREIRIYNQRLTADVEARKLIDEVGASSQGQPVFLFRLEKYAGDGDGPGAVVAAETIHVAFDPERAVADESDGYIHQSAYFDGLEAGYWYRITELGAMRYGLEDDQNAVTLTGGSADASIGTVNGAAVTFFLSGDIAEDGNLVATFKGSRQYADYLSDTAVSVNGFTRRLWPEPSKPK